MSAPSSQHILDKVDWAQLGGCRVDRLLRRWLWTSVVYSEQEVWGKAQESGRYSAPIQACSLGWGWGPLCTQEGAGGRGTWLCLKQQMLHRSMCQDWVGGPMLRPRVGAEHKSEWERGVY